MVDALMPVLPALLVFVAVASGTIALVLFFEVVRSMRRRRTVLGRLDPQEEQDTPRRQSTGLLRRSNVAATTRTERLIARIPGLRDARLRLQRAGLSWPVQTYLLLAAGSAVAFGLGWFTITGSAVVAIAVAVLGALLPDLFIYRRRLKRLRLFEEQFPEAIDLLGRAIRAGHPLASAIRMVAEETAEPVAGEFRQVFEEQRFGLPFEDALLGLSDRNTLVDVRIFVTAVLIQREAGGNLAEILDKIAQTVRARFTIFRQLRVYTAQGRMSGFVLALLPIVVAGAIWFLQPDYMQMLITDPLGQTLIVMAIALQLIGYVWITRIVNIRV